jgi:hypothetical protein
VVPPPPPPRLIVGTYIYIWLAERKMRIKGLFSKLMPNELVNAAKQIRLPQ